MPLKPVIRRISPAEKREDGIFHLTGYWNDRPMPIFPGQHIGITVALEGDGEELTLLLQAFDATGATVTAGATATLENGKVITYDFEPREQELAAPSRFEIAVADMNNFENHTRVTAETYPGGLALLGSDHPVPAATEHAITKLENQVNAPLCDDHRRFLEKRNGLNLLWWETPNWDTFGSKDDDIDFFEALTEAEAEAEDIGVLQDTRHLFGLGSGHPYLDYPEALTEFTFYHPEFLRHGIPVGADTEGSLFVQILSGERKGEIVLIDQDFHEEMRDLLQLDKLPDDRLSLWPPKPYDEISTDEFWAMMRGVGYALPAASSLTDMFRKLAEHHRGLMTALAPKWRIATPDD